HFCTIFSIRRRCTGSSSAIKMVAAMALLTLYNYLSRIGALWPMPINARLSLDPASSPQSTQPFRSNTDFEPDDLALPVRPPQIPCAAQIEPKEIRSQGKRQGKDGEASGMEPFRPLFRDRRAGSRARPAKDGFRLRRV